MKIYIPHYKKLTSRKTNILHVCERLNLQSQLITGYDKEDLPDFSNNQKDECWEEMVNEIKVILLKNAGLDVKSSFDNTWLSPRALKKAEVSLTYKHLISLLAIYADGECGIVLEDDIELHPNSTKILEEARRLIKEDIEYIDLGGGCRLPFYSKDHKVYNSEFIVKTNPPRSRTTAGYIVTPKAALKIAMNLFPAILPLDWSYQYIFLKEKMSVAWTNPPAFIHGSQNNQHSSIQ